MNNFREIMRILQHSPVFWAGFVLLAIAGFIASLEYNTAQNNALAERMVSKGIPLPIVTCAISHLSSQCSLAKVIIDRGDYPAKKVSP